MSSCEGSKTWTGDYRDFYKRPNIVEPDYHEYRFVSRLQPAARNIRRNPAFAGLGPDSNDSTQFLPETIIDEILNHGLVEDLLDDDPLQFGAPRPEKPDLPPRPSSPLESGAGLKLARLPPEPVIGPLPNANYSFAGLSLGPVNDFITRVRRTRAKRKCDYRHKHWEQAARRIKEENSRVLALYEKEVKSSQQYEDYLAADAYWLQQSQALNREYEFCTNQWYAHRHYFEEAKRQERDYIASLKSAVDCGQVDAIEYVVTLALLEVYHRRFSLQIETADAETVLSVWQ